MFSQVELLQVPTLTQREESKSALLYELNSILQKEILARGSRPQTAIGRFFTRKINVAAQEKLVHLIARISLTAPDNLRETIENELSALKGNESAYAYALQLFYLKTYTSFMPAIKNRWDDIVVTCGYAETPVPRHSEFINSKYQEVNEFFAKMRQLHELRND